MKICPDCSRENSDSVRYCHDCGTLLDNTPVRTHSGELAPDTILSGRYKIIQKIGKGGMGAVYKAIDLHLVDKIIAIKELSYSSSCDDIEKRDAKEAFKQEARILAFLSHSSLPRVTDYFSDGGKEYLVMDFIEGETLQVIINKTQGFLSERDVKDWAIQLCDVLEYLHGQIPPIIFRDLKPSNIILEQRKRIKLIDFGIARLFKAGKDSDTTTLGTEGYAPPEQHGGKQTDGRSDIYALGVTLHQLLTKHDPMELPYVFPPIRSINPSISEHFEKIINRAIELKPSDRWQTAMDMKQAFIISNGNQYQNIPPQPPPVNQFQNIPPQPSPVNQFQNIPPQPPPVNQFHIQPPPIQSQVNHPPFVIPPQRPPQPVPAPQSGPKPLIVSSQGKGDYPTINDAMRGAREGDKILVRPGVYREEIMITKRVEIFGDGLISEIIIESQGRCIVMNAGEASVRNLTLKSNAATGNLPAVDIAMGKLLLEDCHIYSQKSSCIAIHGFTSNPLIRRCTLKDGGENGLTVYDSGTGTVEFCDIIGNVMSGIEIYGLGNPVIKRCKIYNSKNCGIKVHKNASGTIDECEIFSNGKTGVIIQENGKPFIQGCKIYNESRGVIVSNNGGGKFENCLIYSSAGAVVEISGNSNPHFTGCRVYDGKAQGFYICNNASGSIEDCEVFRNNGVGIEITTKSNPVIKGCKIHDCKSHGIYVWLNGSGTIEDCHIYSNSGLPFEISNCKPIVKNCKII